MGLPTGATVALTADGVTVLFDVTDGRLPAVLHWGAAAARPGRRAGRRDPHRAHPGDRLEQRRLAAAGGRAARAPRRLAGPARAVRLPGRAVLVARSSGPPRCAWTATAVTGFVTAGAAPARGRRGRRRGRPGAAAGPRAAAQRPAARAGRRSPTPPTTYYGSTSWCWPSRCPPRPTELLDFGGRHNRERIPQRRPLRHRHPPAGEPQGPDRRGQRLRAARRHPGLRLRRRRGLRRAHRVERQPHALRRAGVHRRAGARRRRAAAARGDRAGARRELPQPVGLRRVRRSGWTQVAAPVPPAPARPPRRRCPPTDR